MRVWRKAGSLYSRMMTATRLQTVVRDFDVGCHSCQKIRSMSTHKFNVKASSRPKTKRPIKLLADDGASRNQTCVTYATADKYSYTPLIDRISQEDRLAHVKLPVDITNAVLFKTNDAGLVKTDGTGYIFIFREGALSFWNVSSPGMKEFTRMANKYEQESYPIQLISWESEQMDYRYVDTPTKFHKDCFEICETTDPQIELYAFTNALMMSVKLAHWEHNLDQLISSIEALPMELMMRSKLQLRSSEAVLEKIGEIFLLRHRLNLQHNLRDLPDVCWDRENIETLYTQTTEFLNIGRRVDIMNEKLSYCAHILELVRSHQSEQKAHRIEILIVLLILIEVAFEVIHFAKEYFQTRAETDDGDRQL